MKYLLSLYFHQLKLVFLLLIPKEQIRPKFLIVSQDLVDAHKKGADTVLQEDLL